MPLTVEAPPEYRPAPGPISIGLVNNMPDRALKATEAQFTTLLAAAAGPLDVRLRFSWVPEVPRGAPATAALAASCWSLDALLATRPDALIVTGTEPRAAALEDEPYWRRMVQLVTWAQAHTISSIWSCLAAHAATQILDGVRRRRLPHKRIGVFAHERLDDHPLLHGIDSPLLTPHSRWNELPAQTLQDAGYTVVTLGPDSGVDLFVKPGRSLLVGFQGHPEYEDRTLLKEYRRDVGRYLLGEHRRWPALPQHYFTPQALAALRAFRARAEPWRDPALLGQFPAARLAAGLRANWRPAAQRVYRNWLAHLGAVKRRDAPAGMIAV